MSASLILFIRILFAWALVLGVAGVMWAQFFGETGSIFVLLASVLLVMATMSVITHVQRVRLLAGRLDHDTLASRQRRQIEIPLGADASLALLDAAIRGLPRLEVIESLSDTLQVQAKVRRIDAYEGRKPSRWNVFARCAIKRDRVLATIAPGAGTCSAMLLFEPDAAAWVDLFAVDEGNNYESAEAVMRSISRQVAERRRDEQANAEQVATDKALAVARLNLLQAQVEPHFLYNTLSSAQVLTRTDPPRADAMIGHLIQYLRRSLPCTDDTLSTLGEELERAQEYLEILRIRMGTRLALQVEVPFELRSVPLPAMMLQTLVENAIKHGLEPKPGGGTIWILARQGDARVTVTVADDGLGFNRQSSGTGIGLNNLRERLKLTYGDAATFALVANFPAGMAATISLPLPTSMPVQMPVPERDPRESQA